MIFLDADNVLSGEAIREHAIRNVVVPDQLYTSLVMNVTHEELSTELGARLQRHQPLPMPRVFNEYRTYELVKAGSPGTSYPYDVELEILKSTDNFRSYGYGRRLGSYDLPSMFATYCVSMTKDLFENIGGFNERFKGWGMEDTYMGACGIALNAKIVPLLACGTYSIQHPSHSGSEECERSELERNLAFYRQLLRE